MNETVTTTTKTRMQERLDAVLAIAEVHTDEEVTRYIKNRLREISAGFTHGLTED